MDVRIVLSEDVLAGLESCCTFFSTESLLRAYREAAPVTCVCQWKRYRRTDNFKIEDVDKIIPPLKGYTDSMIRALNNVLPTTARKELLKDLL